jgi:hypothetical protein
MAAAASSGMGWTWRGGVKFKVVPSPESFLFILYLSLSSGAGWEKEER